MLSENEIKNEARKIIKEMDPAKRKELENSMNEAFEIAKKLNTSGTRSLSKEEKTKWYKFNDTLKQKISGGGIETAEIEYEIMGSLNISKDEIKTMKKNPYKASMLRQIILAAIANLGIVVTYGISKSTGLDLESVIPVLSGLSGLFSLGFATQLVKSVKFRNLQKKYENEDFQQKEVDSAVFMELYHDVARKRGLL